MNDNTAPKPTRDELARAITLNFIDEVEELLKRGADFNEEDKHLGWDALTLAANFGRREIAELLIKAGAEIDKKCRGGVTPLMRAAMCGSANIVRLLVERGADVSLRDEAGLDALSYAQSRKRPEIAQLIEEAPLHRQHAAILKKQQRLYELAARRNNTHRRLKP